MSYLRRKRSGNSSEGKLKSFGYKVALALGRDGILNYPGSGRGQEIWRPLQGVPQLIARLCRIGVSIYVVSLRKDRPKNSYEIDLMDEINGIMSNTIRNAGGRITAIYSCNHLLGDDCHCHRGSGGVLERVAQAEGVALKDVIFAGSSLEEINLASSLGLECYFVLNRLSGILSTNQLPLKRTSVVASPSLVFEEILARSP